MARESKVRLRSFELSKACSGVIWRPSAQAVWPQLTTNQVHRELMGAKAVQLLIERIKNPATPQQSLVLNTTFIERASTSQHS